MKALCFVPAIVINRRSQAFPQITGSLVVMNRIQYDWLEVKYFDVKTKGLDISLDVDQKDDSRGCDLPKEETHGLRVSVPECLVDVDEPSGDPSTLRLWKEADFLQSKERPDDKARNSRMCSCRVCGCQHSYQYL